MYDVPFDQQIAGGDDALLRQVDDDVAGGVAAAEEQDADLARAAVQRHRLRQRHRRRRRLDGVGALEVIALDIELVWIVALLLVVLRGGEPAFERLDRVGHAADEELAGRRVLRLAGEDLLRARTRGR